MARWLSMLVLAVLLGKSMGLAGEEVALIKVEGAIGPATAAYIARAVDHAAASGAQALILQLNTPGGLLTSTQEIVQKLLGSTVPIVVFVFPAGATATSAGCFITLAAHIAAMEPATSIGAAHPVALGGGGMGETKPDPTMERKLENFASSYIETIAARRRRNVEWARSAVRDSASVPAEKALALNVIDLLAKDLHELLQKLDGRAVQGRNLQTAKAQIREIPMSARERVFQTLWRPEVMFILMLIAIYGIIGELSNPGAILPGVLGGIALILALYMAAILPVNVAGLALIILGLILFVVDVYAPTHGVLTVGGVVSFFLGALMLFDRSDPLFRLSLSLIVPATVLTAAFFIFIVTAGLRAQFLPVRAGVETFIGQTVPALELIHTLTGKVFVEGEYWNARSDTPIPEGQPVEIVAVQGLTLKVKPKQA